MDSIKLIIEPDSFSIGSNAKEEIIYGNLYFQIGQKFYPDKQWNDFIVRILLTWSNNLLNNHTGTLYFCDGPYEVKFTKENNMITLMVEEMGEYKLGITDFFENMLQCLNAVSEYINNKNILINKQIIIQQYIERISKFKENGF